MSDKNKILAKLNSLKDLIAPYAGIKARNEKAFVDDMIVFLSNSVREKLTLEEMHKLNTIFHNYKDGNTVIDKRTGTVKKKVIAGSGLKDSLKSVSVVFTGFRDENFEREIVKNGGTVYGSISSSVTHLICKDVKANTVKMKKARDLGIKILQVRNFTDFLIQK